MWQTSEKIVKKNQRKTKKVKSSQKLLKNETN